MRLMVIDDDEKIIENLALILEELGYDVDAYSDPQLALENFDPSYSIVLSDIKMPKVDGYKVLQKVKEIRPDTKVILISGFANSLDVATALQLGAYKVFFKPIDVYELIETIQALESDHSLS